MVFKTLAAVFVALVAIQLVRGSHVEKNGLWNDRPHSINLGERVSGDSLLITDNIKHDRNHYRWVLIDYVWPPVDVNNQNIFITNVVVTDNVKNGKGGYPSLKRGGPGSPAVVLRLLSKWNKGIDFTISVYGFPKPPPPTS